MSLDETKRAARGKLNTPTDLGANAVTDIASALNGVLADSFALYFKTKNFHWHVSGPHFRDYHLMLDEQAGEIFGSTDDIAERVRKLGGTTLRSVQQVAAMSRIAPNEADFVEPADMLAELGQDTKACIAAMRAARTVCEDHGDTATSSMMDDWIDQAERRLWFLYETSRPAMTGGH